MSPPGAPVRGEPRFDVFEAFGELPVAGAQRVFRIGSEMPGGVDAREEQVAELLGDFAGVRAPVERGAQLPELLVDLVEDRRRVRPVETDSGRATLELLGARQRRQGEGHAVERAGCRACARGALFGLLPFPGAVQRSGIGFARTVAEDVGVAPAHLFGDGAGDVVEIECAALAGELGVEDDLEQQVAQLVTESREVAARDRVGGLVGFFDRAGGDGLESLHGVPRATVLGIPQPRHQREQGIDRRTRCAAFTHVHLSHNVCYGTSRTIPS